MLGSVAMIFQFQFGRICLGSYNKHVLAKLLYILILDVMDALKMTRNAMYN